MGMDVYGKKPSNDEGKYFRANVWSWRPIHKLCETVLAQSLPWSTNDGEGFKTQAECTKLADKLEAYLQKFPQEKIEIESDMRVDANGVFLPRGTTDGESAYSTSRGHVMEFIKFLRHCGGFEVR